MLIIYDNMDIEQEHTIGIQKDNFIQSIDKDIFFELLFKNYKTSTTQKENILKQFLIDFKRQDVFINNKKITNVFEFITFVYSEIANNNDILFHEILLLSQQTPFAEPVKYINKKLTPLIISESGSKMSVKIDKNNVEIFKKLKIVSFDEELKNISRLEITICFDICNAKINIEYLFRSFEENYGFELI